MSKKEWYRMVCVSIFEHASNQLQQYRSDKL